ncbi:MAG: dihydroorotate dehydrogenase electron transfer subunit [Bacteroidota bacterium]|nr:dihydroorotate dehydrogenase electron transfer subunit [Bacteroidota bacterium]MDP4231193.1 dihydroorotate dehydrogenase electron transfer subunit [Bacteroidota bacterium]MDP4235573.1 dihydroorotate dehydrogenase electron transfer subunit [Bacteroidota bacterium]
MTQEKARSKIYQSKILSRREISSGLVVLSFHNPFVAETTQPGQFVNVLPKIGMSDPLLRRPFSVYHCDGESAEIIIQDHGRGTAILAHSQPGEYLDVLGPLGRPWNFDEPDYRSAILLIGGVGVASMPLLTKKLAAEGKNFATYYGARSASLFADEYLDHVEYSTDDGSKGFHGTVIEHLRGDLKAGKYDQPKLFVCGPTGMMRAAIGLANEFKIKCEVSLETEMACGIGICQGCPIETSVSESESTGRKFHLVCTHGPSFAKEQIVL